MRLHLSAMSGDVAAVRRLVASGADLEQPDDNFERQLYYAAAYGQAVAVKALLELGANKEANRALGATPLHEAALNQQAEAMKTLVEQALTWRRSSRMGRRHCTCPQARGMWRRRACWWS